MPTYDDLKNELKEIAKLLSEFPDSVRPQVYDLLITQFAGPSASSTTVKTQPPENAKTGVRGAESQAKREKSTTSRRSALKESYTVDRNLNLRPGSGTPSFREFFDQKQPRTAQEFNAVAVYYLKKVLEMDTATLNHAYTCYREVNRPQPKAFKQSFIDAKNKGGWLEFDEEGNLLIPHRGAVFVEHDLPHERDGSGKV